MQIGKISDMMSSKVFSNIVKGLLMSSKRFCVSSKEVQGVFLWFSKGRLISSDVLRLLCNFKDKKTLGVP